MPRFKPLALFATPLFWGTQRSIPRPWLWGLILLVLLGIGLRWAHLDSRIFWVDEVATAVRIGGYTQAEVEAEVGDGAMRTPADLLRYVQGPSDRPQAATLHALIRSPEHAPLYFWLVRQWTGIWGRTRVGLRSFSVLLSLLTLPALYWMVWEWMRSPIPSGIAVGLMAISPLLIAYAQEARPYSLWLLLLVLSAGLLLRALHTGRQGAWVGYSFTLTLGLYTSLLTLPIAIAQGLYVFALEKGRLTRPVRRGWLAIGASLAAFSPWLMVVVRQWGTLQTNTAWMQEPTGFVERIGIWIYTLSILVFDTPVAPLGTLPSILQISTSVGILMIFGWAAMGLVTHTHPRLWGWVLTLAIPTPLLLMLADLILGGKRATAPRYWLPTHLALIVILAGWLGIQEISNAYPKAWNRRWQQIVALFLAIALLCSLGNLGRSPRYLKTRNLHNPAIATWLNAATHPRVLATPSEVYDLISLSQFLKPTVEIQVFEADSLLVAISPCHPETFIFNPSTDVQQRMGRHGVQSFQAVYTPAQLTSDELILSLWQAMPDPQCLPGSG